MNNLADGLRELVDTYPRVAASARAIAALDQHLQQRPLEPFFEPVSVTLVSKNQKAHVRHELLNVTCDDLTSWTHHIAYGTRCRMRNLEAPIVEHLGRGAALPGMILLRSHLEAAALTAHCLTKLREAGKQGDVEPLKELIASTLFGTSLKKHGDKVAVSEFLKFFEGETIRMCAAVNSLDNFYYQEYADGKLSVVYSLLCEYAHPNHRSAMDFMTASECPGGWEIKYQLDAMPSDDLIVGALDTLLVSMRAGYSAGQLLLHWAFSEEAGEIVCRGPSPEEWRSVWEGLLQRNTSGAA